MNHPSQEPFFTNIKANSASEFVQNLAAIASRSTIQAQLIWRGVGRNTYELIPSAGRETCKSYLHAIGQADAGTTSIAENEANETLRVELDDYYREYAALIHFCRRANEQALPLPVAEHNLYDAIVRQTDLGFVDYFLGKHVSTFQAWPPKPIWPLLGLAQHYGIPTRLLDWSRDYRVAAYFATTTALREMFNLFRQNKKINLNEGIAVWMLNATAAERTAQFGRPTRNEPDGLPYTVHIIDVPYHGNENLAAQRGRFTLITGRGINRHKTCLSEILRSIDGELHNKPYRVLVTGSTSNTLKNHLCRFDLPYGEVPALFALLRKEGYDSNRLFPGYAGAARATYDVELSLEVQKKLAEQTSL